jgi:hypothetical protein
MTPGRTWHMRDGCCVRGARRRRRHGPGVPENWTRSVLAAITLGGSYFTHGITMKPFENCEALWQCALMMARFTGFWASR